jgi:hypothetical protein
MKKVGSVSRRPNRRRSFKRVSWAVRRSAAGWEPIILVGETPIYLEVQSTKPLARELARTKAVEFSRAGV